MDAPSGTRTDSQKHYALQHIALLQRLTPVHSGRDASVGQYLSFLHLRCVHGCTGDDGSESSAGTFPELTVRRFIRLNVDMIFGASLSSSTSIASTNSSVLWWARLDPTTFGTIAIANAGFCGVVAGGN